MEETTEQHIDASSMIALKAELYKKQEAVKLAKLKSDSGVVKRKGLKLKGEEVYKKPKKSSQPLPTLHVSEEEEEALKRSRLALERKAKLYDKILSKKVSLDDNDDDELYMVDFRRKLMDSKDQPRPNSKSSLERTSVAEQEDNQILSPDEKPTQRYEDFFFVAGSNTNTTTSSVNVSKENDSGQQGPIHYQNIQYNEVRDHGVGYYAFSTDEEERKEQMELLNNLKQQTEKKKATFQNLEKKRKNALQARLAKICERRNIDKSTIENYISKNDDDQLPEATEKSIDIDISDIPLPDGEATNVVLPPKPVKVRPWDEGKDVFGYQSPAPKSSRGGWRMYRAWREQLLYLTISPA